ncbi:MAG TPA: hypothetical protein VFW64_13025 [Pseudonocardiaceae bacterium]|nr:hypothetical protein [Pseudonocardiaceae bacterium]
MTTPRPLPLGTAGGAAASDAAGLAALKAIAPRAIELFDWIRAEGDPAAATPPQQPREQP